MEGLLFLDVNVNPLHTQPVQLQFSRRLGEGLIKHVHSGRSRIHILLPILLFNL